MNADTIFVFSLITVAGILMASNRVRYDVVALMVVLALIISDTLTVGQALSGFGSPVVIMVAGLLVVGEMLTRTGVAGAVGDWILRHGGGSEWRLLVLVMLGTAVLGAIMSSTAVVAIFIPIVLRIAANTGINEARMLLPMSYAGLISGMLTLIGTTPNIVIHEELINEGYAGFGFFEFTAVGLLVLFVAVVYILLIGRRLLGSAESSRSEKRNSARQLVDLWRQFNESDEILRYHVPANSPLVGRAVGEVELEGHYDLRIVSIEPRNSSGDSVSMPNMTTVIADGDILMLIGAQDQLDLARTEQNLVPAQQPAGTRRKLLWRLGGASVLVHPDSTYIGKTIREGDFRLQFGLNVLGMRRGNEIVEDYSTTPLASGDSLFVAGPWSRIRSLGELIHDFVVVGLPSEFDDEAPERGKMPIAIGILVAMIGLMMFDLVPVTAAVLIAVLAAVFSGCLEMRDAYRSIDWASIVLIAGMLPLSDALTATGGTQLIVDNLMAFASGAGPYLMMTLLFFLTAFLGLVLSNTASAVLVIPIAIYAAEALDVSPYPFAIAVLIAASSAYSTPVSTPVVTLVVDPGRYRFLDFIKVGLPLLVLTYFATLLATPLVFPF